MTSRSWPPIHVTFFPREVVVVLGIDDDMCAECAGDVFVDKRVVRGGVVAHRIHRGPVLLAGFFIERQPRRMLQLLRQLCVVRHREAGCNADKPARPCHASRCG